MSLVTLWRARNAGIPHFPEPVILRGMIFWRKCDLDKLEDVVLKFNGRTKFEERRDHTKRLAALTKAHPQSRRAKRSKRTDERQQDLF